jgi:hypothetical protein
MSRTCAPPGCPGPWGWWAVAGCGPGAVASLLPLSVSHMVLHAWGDRPSRFCGIVVDSSLPIIFLYCDNFCHATSSKQRSVRDRVRTPEPAFRVHFLLKTNEVLHMIGGSTIECKQHAHVPVEYASSFSSSATCHSARCNFPSNPSVPSIPPESESSTLAIPPCAFPSPFLAFPSSALPALLSGSIRAVPLDRSMHLQHERDLKETRLSRGNARRSSACWPRISVVHKRISVGPLISAGDQHIRVGSRAGRRGPQAITP